MKKNILVVDDSPLMLTMLRDVLVAFGYVVTVAKSGHVGCQLLETNRYNLIITDLNMPGMDGVAFVKKVREIPDGKYVPIVIMTGENDKNRIAEAKSVGISTFLEKPFKGSQLKTIIEVILGSQ
jgi:two-component system chemotaxis response regulator CheY